MHSLVHVPSRYVGLGLGSVAAALALEVLYRLNAFGLNSGLLLPFALFAVVGAIVAARHYAAHRSDDSRPKTTEEDPSEVTESDGTKISAGAITGDNPIRRQEEDTIGRQEPARSFAHQVMSLDAREGAVVGVL